MMSIDVGLLPLWWLVLGGLMSLVVLGIAGWAANWRTLSSHSSVQHVFFAACLALGLCWSIRAGISAGMGVHFLGMVAATLVMGWPLALVAGAVALVGVTFVGLEAWEALGINFLFSVLLPALSGYWVTRWVQANLPANPFVYIFLCGFFNGALSIALVASCTALMLGGLGIYEWAKVYDDYYRYLPLMLFPEAFLNGMIIAGLVGAAPNWLSSFDVNKYFKD